MSIVFFSAMFIILSQLYVNIFKMLKQRAQLVDFSVTEIALVESPKCNFLFVFWYICQQSRTG